MILKTGVKLLKTFLRTENKDSPKSCKIVKFPKIIFFLKIVLTVVLLGNFDVIIIPCNILRSWKVAKSFLMIQPLEKDLATLQLLRNQDFRKNCRFLIFRLFDAFLFTKVTWPSFVFSWTLVWLPDFRWDARHDSCSIHGLWTHYVDSI